MQQFDLDNLSAYKTWREQKLANYPTDVNQLVVSVQNPVKLSGSEMVKIKDCIDKANMVVYESPYVEPSKIELHRFAQQFGLERFDKHLYADQGVSEISISKERRQGEFIPYTDKGLKWHTDGYYSYDGNWVASIVLHCIEAAEAGGINQLLDPEILYLYIRDADPRFTKALMSEDALTIPGFKDKQGNGRDDSTGPVFWFTPEGDLQMRYTQRSTNIDWKTDSCLDDARSLINELLLEGKGVFTHKLKPGQGLLSNNVLHNRSAFTEKNSARRLLRARYLDRIKFKEESME